MAELVGNTGRQGELFINDISEDQYDRFTLMPFQLFMHSLNFLRSYVIFLGVLWLSIHRLTAAELPDGYHVVRDCQDEWLVYSAEYKNYVPFVRSLHESEPSVSMLLNLVRDRHFQLMLKSRREAVLFVDGALQQKLIPDQWLMLSLDSLSRKYQNREVILTVFGLRGMDGLSAYMAFPRTEQATDSLQVLSRSLVSLKPKTANVYRDFAVIAWLLILIVSAIVFISVPSIAYKMASPVAFFSRDFRSELYNHHRAYSPLIIFGVAVLSLIVSFLLITIEMFVYPILPPFLGVSERESFGQLTFDYLSLTLLCFALFYLKYFVISITLGILNMSEIAHIHFIKALQSSILFYGAISAGLLILIYQYTVSLENLGAALLWGITIYYCARYLVLYIVLNQTARIINLYLISYLCVVELIPLIIGIKFIM